MLLFCTLVFFVKPVEAQYYQEHTTKNDIKFTILSLGSGSTRLTYERAFTPLNSAELTIGIVGWGWDFLHHTNSSGILFKAAFKWTLFPQNNANSWLAGFYLKPEFVGAIFDYTPDLRTVQNFSIKHTNQYALIAECGYQLVLKWFVFDVYAGMGPSFGTGNDNNYFHSFLLFPRNWPLAFTSGFRIGVAF